MSQLAAAQAEVLNMQQNWSVGLSREQTTLEQLQQQQEAQVAVGRAAFLAAPWPALDNQQRCWCPAGLPWLGAAWPPPRGCLYLEVRAPYVMQQQWVAVAEASAMTAPAAWSSLPCSARDPGLALPQKAVHTCPFELPVFGPEHQPSQTSGACGSASQLWPAASALLCSVLLKRQRILAG